MFTEEQLNQMMATGKAVPEETADVELKQDGEALETATEKNEGADIINPHYSGMVLNDRKPEKVLPETKVPTEAGTIQEFLAKSNTGVVIEKDTEPAVSEPESNAAQYMDNLKEDLLDPQVMEIRSKMAEFVPQSVSSLGPTEEGDKKYEKPERFKQVAKEMGMSEEQLATSVVENKHPDATVEEKKELVAAYLGTKVKEVPVLVEGEGFKGTEPQLVSYSTEKDPNPSEEAQRYNEAAVVIDKFNKAHLQFTDEEKRKLEFADKIVVTEVEDVNLRHIRRRKSTDGVQTKSVGRLRTNSQNVVNVPLLSSGIIARMNGCAPYEVMSLNMEEGTEPHQRQQIHTDFLYRHLVDTSRGKLTRVEFDKLGFNDLEMMFYGVLCATYQDEDYIPYKCNSDVCNGKEFQHYYSTRSLLRAEKFNEEAIEMIQKLTNITNTIEAHNIANSSSVNSVRTIRLPESKIVLSCSEASIGRVTANLPVIADIPPAYANAVASAIYINAALVPDVSADEVHMLTSEELADIVHDEYVEYLDVIEIIQQLSAKDISILLRTIGEISDNLIPEFGFFDITCPNCGKKHETADISPSELLFFRTDMEMSRQVE